ncbi:hypothetical protein OOK58_58900 [Streptomyces sp. NBC_01728]|uniref:hypothetical protein n=1 Tax=unclassified Streptomyces TaxID=2593676 RepID=UPI00225B942B|nr:MULTISPECIES: hypothetical protein [unclassified Streptomyces]MCX4462378.1 hypothetical protein [Streptomyces sp. NBC_01719]MCX4500808.1 hypothetical protein [Streptomyces sp. NBC_01728]
MAYVRGHYRRDGSYVRPHHRRTRPAAPTSPRSVTYSRSVSTRPPSPAGPTTYVRGHYRNGSYVRPHHRRIGRPAVVAAAGGGSVLLIVLVALALLSFGGTGSKGTPSTASGNIGTAGIGENDHGRLAQ